MTQDTHTQAQHFTFTITLSPERAQYDQIHTQLHTEFGANYNRYDEEPSRRFNELYAQAQFKVKFYGRLKEAETWAEPLRRSHPDRNVNIVWHPAGHEQRSFIGYTSWNDQMEMYPEYPVFTQPGHDERVKALTRYHHKQTQVLENWSADLPLESYLEECGIPVLEA
tara:strand:- start:389 stop:889 length:501 start_codon:yes stop_codon:yes gene_type:complete